MGAVRHLPEAEGTEAVRVAEGDELLRRHDDARERPAELPHRLLDGRLGRAAGEPVPDDLIGDGLRVGRAVEDGAGQLEAPAQSGCVGQVPVVDEGEIALDMADDERLDVAALMAAGRGIPHMPDRHLTAAQLLQRLLREHLGDQSVRAVLRHHAAVADRDAAALLPAVLERVKSQIGAPCHVHRLRCEDAEHAALFMKSCQMIALSRRSVIGSMRYR